MKNQIKYLVPLLCLALASCTATAPQTLTAAPKTQAKHTGSAIYATVRKAATKHGVPVNVALAVTQTESSFNCKARSSVGALGAMQIMPGTARLHGYTGAPAGLLSCDTGIEYGMRALKQCHSLAKGNLAKIGACYNAGPGSLKWRNLPLETRNYIKKLHKAV